MAALDKYSVSAFGTSASSSITSKQRICSKQKTDERKKIDIVDENVIEKSAYIFTCTKAMESKKQFFGLFLKVLAVWR